MDCVRMIALTKNIDKRTKKTNNKNTNNYSNANLTYNSVINFSAEK